MATKTPKLEIEQVLCHDALEIMSARARAIVVHHTKDIDAAGDVVEATCRDVIARRIPDHYHVGHGHIVDRNLVTSPQLDVIVADTHRSPSLLRLDSGVTYYPYEAVYAVGEIKSTYSRSKGYIESFSEVLKTLDTELARAPTPPSYVAPGVNLGRGFATHSRYPSRNPLYSFMLFVNSGDFSLDHIRAHYAATPLEHLPNTICFLDRGMLIFVNAKQTPAGRELARIYVTPRFYQSITLPEDLAPESGCRFQWALVPFGTAETRAGAQLAILQALLLAHLHDAILLPPDLVAYMNALFKFSNAEALE